VVKLVAGSPTELRGSRLGGAPATASMRAASAPGFARNASPCTIAA